MNSYASWKDYNFFLFMMIIELAKNEWKSNVMFIVFAFGYVALLGIDLCKRFYSKKI